MSHQQGEHISCLSQQRIFRHSLTLITNAFDIMIIYFNCWVGNFSPFSLTEFPVYPILSCGPSYPSYYVYLLISALPVSTQICLSVVTHKRVTRSPPAARSYPFSRDYEFNGLQSLNFRFCDSQNLNYHPIPASAVKATSLHLNTDQSVGLAFINHLHASSHFYKEMPLLYSSTTHPHFLN